MWIDEVFLDWRSEPPRRSVDSGESYILSQIISQMTFLQCCLRICKVVKKRNRVATLIETCR